MRLSKRIVKILKIAINDNFGDVKIYLFGSRTDDNKKGGDIDIALDINIQRDDFRRKKSSFIASLIRMGFDMKIDLVQYNKDDELLYSEIKSNSILI
jgi:predicted nucleotidyltransferase